MRRIHSLVPSLSRALLPSRTLPPSFVFRNQQIVNGLPSFIRTFGELKTDEETSSDEITFPQKKVFRKFQTPSDFDQSQESFDDRRQSQIDEESELEYEGLKDTDEINFFDKDQKPLGKVQLQEALRITKQKGLELFRLDVNGREFIMTTLDDIDKIRLKREYDKKKEAKRKKQSESKQKQLKTVRFRDVIDQNDLNIKIRNVNSFIKDKFPVRLEIIPTPRTNPLKSKAFLLKVLGLALEKQPQVKTSGLQFTRDRLYATLHSVEIAKSLSYADLKTDPFWTRRENVYYDFEETAEEKPKKEKVVAPKVKYEADEEDPTPKKKRRSGSGKSIDEPDWG
eukprot:TRINITY_DN9239_c0_g1_i1.p1 TRINITY_DN9239_c0_g1~~TRINITY_DN9239_c0_g1_i1.p1  ORF type:complete len:339 (-),score=96.24 TRINITY_DN9239_c0_g1_i1:111-1127(-)